MIAYNIAITRDSATPAVRALEAGLTPAQINPIVGRAGVNVTRSHFQALNRERPNALGGARTNYYLGAARSAQFREVENGVIVSAAQVGLRLRYYGGRVTAGKTISRITGRPTKYLTIPVHPRAHGKRAGEFDLELVRNHRGEPVALATKSTRGVSLRQTSTGKVTKRAIGQRGEIMFLLRRSVVHRPDPSILPTLDQLYGAALSALGAHTDRVLERKGGG